MERYRRVEKGNDRCFTTHYLDEVEHLSDRVGIITKGKIKAVGTVKEITEQTGKNSLEEAFLSLTEEDV